MVEPNITVQPQVDIESDASVPLLPVAMGAPADAPAGPKETNCCMIACCAPLTIANGGKDGPDPKPTPTATAMPSANAHRAWAHAFRLNVVLTVAAAVCFGGMAIEALINDQLSGEGRRRLMHAHHAHAHEMDLQEVHSRHHDGGEHDSDEGEEVGKYLSNTIVGGLALLAIASAVSAGMLHSLFSCGRGFLHRSYAAFVGLLAGIAVVLLLSGAVVISVVYFALFAVGVVMLRRRQHRIVFGSANLKLASMAIKDMPWTYGSAILLGVLQFFWCVVAMIAALGSFIALETVTAPDGSSHPAITCLDNFDFDDSADAVMATSSCTCGGIKISDEECQFSGFGLPLTVIWLCSMMWGCAVIRNVVACTVSGSVASWWFTPNEDSAPVKGAFHRATTSSFGSLCKAAAVQQLIAVVCHLARRVFRVVPCASALLKWVNDATGYVLSYTIAFIGIYGLNFNEAGGRVRELFKARAVTTLANDMVVELGLAFLALSAFLVYGLMTGMVMFGAFMKLFDGVDMDDAGQTGDMVDSLEFWSVLGPQIFGAVSLVFLVSTVLEVVRSGFKAVFVCFVQDPEMLAEKHGHALHAELNAAWQDMQQSIQRRSAAATTTTTTATANTQGIPVHTTA